MPLKSHIVIADATSKYHSMCVEGGFTKCDIAAMQTIEKNGGPNYLQAWRTFRGLTQGELAERVGTNQNMIGYLENGDRGLSAKWLRRLADALNTTPGFLLDHDPHEMPRDLLDIWGHADDTQKRQIADIAKAIVRTGTED